MEYKNGDEYIMGVVFIICVTIVAIVGISEGGERRNKYRLRKLEEDSKTAKLALVYQILSSRPELTLEDVQKYIESTDDKRRDIERR
ncbi:hypothetical protein [Anaeromicropila herbilytica]|uniref:Uncharacterized protein n=1 Tax=Anaeromicropila herbilytica TaxID=2785025 RepID=A0A7R7IEC9_9FIRM|nr:hypothetical protein [Anaeromicropila herbilytica]BCN32583.1 hypothetical protein bsdtb5_38780 [Anaeromicropila herbilytica]